MHEHGFYHPERFDKEQFQSPEQWTASPLHIQQVSPSPLWSTVRIKASLAFPLKLRSRRRAARRTSQDCCSRKNSSSSLCLLLNLSLVTNEVWDGRWMLGLYIGQGCILPLPFKPPQITILSWLDNQRWL